VEKTFRETKYFSQTKVCQVRVTVDLPTFCLVTIFSVESKELELELEQPKKTAIQKKLINLKELGKYIQKKLDKYVIIENELLSQVCDVNPCCVFVDVCFVLYLFQTFVCLHVCAYTLESGASSLPFKHILTEMHLSLGVTIACGGSTVGQPKAKYNVHCGTKDLRACWQLTATCARPSDARIATTASLFIGVLFCCPQRLQISRTRAELHWIRRHRPHERTATCFSAAQDQRQAL